MEDYSQRRLRKLAGFNRRSFLQSSSLAFLACALPQDIYADVDSSSFLQAQSRQRARPRYFGSGVYTQEQLDQLYGTAVERTRPGTRRAATDRRHMIFYYDDQARLLVNPYNVRPGLTSAKYSMEIKILNSHVAQSDYDTIWKKLKHDGQMQLALTSRSSAGADADDLTWTLMNAIDVFLGGDLQGLDKRLKAFVSNNQPTSRFRPSEKIEIATGTANFLLQLAAQKKQSWWRTLLTIGGQVLNSPLFAILPIPKLFPEALQFANTVLDHLQGSEPLVPVWTSAGIPFKLYEGATPATPFTMRPGFWLTIDRRYAEGHLDANQNLQNHIIDLPGQFWELKANGTTAVDANYSVLELTFPKITT